MHSTGGTSRGATTASYMGYDHRTGEIRHLANLPQTMIYSSYVNAWIVANYTRIAAGLNKRIMHRLKD